MGYNTFLATTLVVGLSMNTAYATNFITIGTPFNINTVNATNTTSSNPVVFVPGLSQIVGGNVELSINTIQNANGTEWLQYSFTSISGPIAGNVNADWEIQVQNVLPTIPVSVDHFFLAWGINGVYYTPTSDTGVNLPIETNPITGVGTVFGEPITGLVESVLDGSGTANTFATLIQTNYGQVPANTNFFQIDELIGPVVTPEPATIAILGLGFLGLCAIRRNKAT